MPSRPKGQRRMFTSSADTDITSQANSRRTRESRQVVMDQLGAEALKQQERPDRPAQQKAEFMLDLRRTQAPSERRRHQCRPGIKDQDRDDRIISGEPAMRLHVGCDPVHDLASNGELEELAARRDADHRKPRGRQDQEPEQPPSPVESIPGGRRPSPPPGEQRRDRDQGRPDRALGQGRQAQEDPERRGGVRRRPWPSTQRQAWQPKSNKANVESVVASFDSRRRSGRSP